MECVCYGSRQRPTNDHREWKDHKVGGEEEPIVSKVGTGLALISRTMSQGDLVQFCFVVNRTEVGKARVQPGPVIEGFDVVEDSGASFGASGKAVMVNQLVFEGTPEGFDEGVVVTVSFATHGSD